MHILYIVFRLSQKEVATEPREGSSLLHVNGGAKISDSCQW